MPWTEKQIINNNNNSSIMQSAGISKLHLLGCLKRRSHEIRFPDNHVEVRTCNSLLSLSLFLSVRVFFVLRMSAIRFLFWIDDRVFVINKLKHLKSLVCCCVYCIARIYTHALFSLLFDSLHFPCISRAMCFVQNIFHFFFQSLFFPPNFTHCLVCSINFVALFSTAFSEIRWIEKN